MMINCAFATNKFYSIIGATKSMNSYLRSLAIGTVDYAAVRISIKAGEAPFANAEEQIESHKTQFE